MQDYRQGSSATYFGPDRAADGYSGYVTVGTTLGTLGGRLTIDMCVAGVEKFDNPFYRQSKVDSRPCTGSRQASKVRPVCDAVSL